jgi:ADP-ribosyl-[dinitrogen reductase] hydrolase
MQNSLNQYRGTLVGVHVGDSLGAPVETWPANHIDSLRRSHGGSTPLFDYPNPWKHDSNGEILPAGRPTDDSDQTADLAHSLITCSGLNPEHLRESLRNSVIFNRSRLWIGRATGAGGTTKKALSDNPDTVRFALANNIGTNGSLMRCSPMALWFGPGLANLPNKNTSWYEQQVHLMSSVTHTHPHSIEACWIYTRVLAALLAGSPDSAEDSDRQKRLIEDMIGVRELTNMEQRLINRLSDPHDFPVDPGAWPERGKAEFSLYVALYALYQSTPFEEGINLAIGIGGDTDTYAAIAGGLLGAKYGYDAIPEDWRTGILGHDTMIDYAERLYSMSQESTAAFT